MCAKGGGTMEVLRMHLILYDFQERKIRRTSARNAHHCR
jgi:hypothetical protein